MDKTDICFHCGHTREMHSGDCHYVVGNDAGVIGGHAVECYCGDFLDAAAYEIVEETVKRVYARRRSR